MEKRFCKSDYHAIVCLSDDIDNDMAKEITTALSDLGTRFLNVPDARILLNINSTGGTVYDAFSIISAIKTCPVRVDTFVSGLAASSAFVISLAGEKRYCSSLATYMFHSVSAISEGTMNNVQNDIEHTLDLQKRMVKFVQKNSRISKKKLEEILKSNKDWYFSPNECVRMGVVDSIVDVEAR